MTQIDAAIVKEQGVTFTVVIVKQHVINSEHERRQAIMSFQGLFPAMPIVLMAQDTNGTPTYWGRQDIARFLASVPMSCIPWKRYTVS